MTRQELINKKLAEPIQLGEKVAFEYKAYESSKPTDKRGIVKVIDENVLLVSIENHKELIALPIDKVKARVSILWETGYNPFDKEQYSLRSSNYDLDSILNEFNDEKYRGDSMRREFFSEYFEYGCPSLNWNPYVFDKDGNKIYYQRGYVWNLKDKQSLINSIYNGLEIGRIVLRKRGYEWVDQQLKSGNKEVAWRDIVDGKQRLSTLIDFQNNVFKDSNGNYYEDMSNSAKHKFGNGMNLLYLTLEEDATDKQTLNCFVKSNFSGVLMNTNHLNQMSEILNTKL